QDDVPMPAMVLARAKRRNSQQAALPLQHLEVKQTYPLAKAARRLLKRNHVGVDLTKNGDDACGIKPAIKADTFVDVVGRDQRVAFRRSAVVHDMRNWLALRFCQPEHTVCPFEGRPVAFG